MIEHRKPPSWPWITALVIALPVLYVASFGSAVWLASDGWISLETFSTAYRPVGHGFAHCPEAIRRPLLWCWQLGGANDIALYFLLLAGPQQAPRPRPVDKSGLRIDWDRFWDGAPTVARVRPDSPAAEAGVEGGDEIRSIDGRPTDDLAPSELRELLAAEGRTVSVVLRRGTCQKVVNICLRNHGESRLRESEDPR